MALLRYVDLVLLDESENICFNLQNWYSYQLNIIQLLGFLTDNGAELLDSILAHIGTSACCDLFVKLIMNLEGPDMKGNLLDVS